MELTWLAPRFKTSYTFPMMPKKASILKKLVMLKGTKNIAILPMFKQLGIIHGMSVGSKTKNMGESFEENVLAVRKRNEKFLKKIGAKSLKNSFMMLKVDRGVSPITEITDKMVEESKKQKRETIKTELRTEALVTMESIPLMAKVGDCFVATIYGKTQNNKNVIALLHLSRNQVDNLLIEKVIELLVSEKYGCRAEEMYAGVFLGMGQKYHTIKAEHKNDLIKEKNWKGFIKKSKDGKLLHLDSFGNILFQLMKSGIDGEKIEAYGYSDAVDTFALAKKHEAFSHRYATSTNQPERNGRHLVVVQLPQNN
jgi:hypothetical protein